MKLTRLLASSEISFELEVTTLRSYLLLKHPLEIATKADFLFVACEPTCSFSEEITFKSVGRQLRTSFCSHCISTQLRVIKEQPCQMRLFFFYHLFILPTFSCSEVCLCTFSSKPSKTFCCKFFQKFYRVTVIWQFL